MDQDGPWSCNLEIYPDFREEKVSEEYTLCTVRFFHRFFLSILIYSSQTLIIYLSVFICSLYLITLRMIVSVYTMEWNKEHVF